MYISMLPKKIKILGLLLILIHTLITDLKDQSVTHEWMKLVILRAKGQLISKGLFGILNIFFQKMNVKFRLNYYDTSGQLVFVRFLEEFENTKDITKLTDL